VLSFSFSESSLIKETEPYRLSEFPKLSLFSHEP
jgi:hypothetical protein